jgi:hypothetical protein
VPRLLTKKDPGLLGSVGWWVLVALALVAVLVGAWMAWRAFALPGLDTATGTITRVHGSPYSTTIEFEDSDHRSHTFRSEYWSQDALIGDQVKVWFDPRNPTKAQTGTDRLNQTLLWSLPGVVGLVAAGYFTLRASGLGFARRTS